MGRSAADRHPRSGRVSGGERVAESVPLPATAPVVATRLAIQQEVLPLDLLGQDVGQGDRDALKTIEIKFAILVVYMAI